MSEWRVIVGDCIAGMQTLDAGSVNTCVTSPPYFGLRDYGHAGQIGLEATPDAYVAQMVAVFREVRRVLRDDGTLWLNLGDSYASETKGTGGSGKSSIGHGKGQTTSAGSRYEPVKLSPGLPSKNLLGIPWRVAFALQADGWYLRQDIIWHKPNPMPESVTDRCTKAHEYIFLLSKSARYAFDADAIKEAVAESSLARWPDGTTRTNASSRGLSVKSGSGANSCGVSENRNRRSVWTVTTKPFAGSHFATFPPDLIEPCILAGCPSGGTVLDPFGGSGTTAGVAIKHGRNAILCELNPAYAAMMPDRVLSVAGGTPDLFITPPKQPTQEGLDL